VIPVAGNSQRRGARRDATKKKGPTVGSGGQRRRALKGKGPTPKAEDRKGHYQNRRKRSADKKASQGRATGGGKSSSARGGRGLREIVFGRNAVVEALRAGVPVKALYVASTVDADDRVREALRIATNKGLPLLEAPRTELDRLADGGPHQGLLLQMPAYDYAAPDELLDAAAQAQSEPLIVALDGVTDPRNLGAVVRSVAAFGGHGVVVPERRSAGMTAGAWKASAGAAARVPVARAKNLTRTLTEYQDAGLIVVGLALEGAVDLDELPVHDDGVVIVVGSEGKGLSRLVTETCDHLVKIPMSGDMESLNAAVAAGIVLHELSRRR
jgi:23S rRNA (guanosine2251-2'-O)-methyltransferase